MTENNQNKYNDMFVFSDHRRNMMFTLTQVIHVYSALTQKHFSCRLSVCLFVCLSQVGVLLKRINVGLHKKLYDATGTLLDFMIPKILMKFKRVHTDCRQKFLYKYSTWVIIGGCKNNSLCFRNGTVLVHSFYEKRLGHNHQMGPHIRTIRW